MKTVIKVGELYIKEYFTKGSTSELVEIVLGYVSDALGVDAESEQAKILKHITKGEFVKVNNSIPQQKINLEY